MNEKQFIKRDFLETLERLCRAKGGDMLRAGKVNQSELKRKTGIDASSISRWFRSEYSPSIEALEKLCAFFRVSASQMLGHEPIPRIDGKTENRKALDNEVSNLDEDQFARVMDFVEYVKQSP